MNLKITNLRLDWRLSGANQLKVLMLQIFFFQLLDATQKRYEVPLDTPKVTKKVTNQDYGFEFTQQPFGLKVFRKSTGSIL